MHNIMMSGCKGIISCPLPNLLNFSPSLAGHEETFTLNNEVLMATTRHLTLHIPLQLFYSFFYSEFPLFDHDHECHAIFLSHFNG